MPHPSHSAQRTCLGCNRRDAQSTMVRIASQDGAVAPDPERRAGGRGGYLHPDRDCLAKFVRSRVREFRSLKRGVALDERRQLADRIAGLILSAAGQRPAADIR